MTFREVASKKDLGRCVEPRGPPGHAARHIGDPGARDVTRRVRATSSRARVSPSLERLGPRNCPVHASGTRRVKAGACSARLAGLRHGNVVEGQRNWHRLVPASSGAKASLACEERQLERVCPRVEYGCRSRRTTPRSREARPAGKRDYADGDRGSRKPPQGGIRELQRCRRSVPRWPSRSADRGPSRAPERASRGRGFRAMEGTPGQIPHRFVHASRFVSDLGDSRGES